MRHIDTKYAMTALADLLLPRTCIVCGRTLQVNERHICLFCLADMPYTGFEHRIHNPMADKFNALIAKHLSEVQPQRTEEGDGRGNFRKQTRLCAENGPEERSREPYAYAAALYFYSHEAGYRQIQYQLKYKGNTDVGKLFGGILGARIASGRHFGSVDAVIPVPLHWTRKFRRGYNQAEIIAKAIAGHLGAPLRTDILVRRRKTKTQTKLDVEAKARNVAGAFSVKPGTDAGGIGHILLVDDVFTTGSTLFACFMALRKAFPAPLRISVACLGFVG